MKFITYQEYKKYMKNINVNQLNEEEKEYKITTEGSDENYNKEKIKEVDKWHDKLFRNILSRKREMVKFLNEFGDLKERIREEQIIQCDTNFITKQYKTKQSDVLYRLKEKPVYFLVEHQSTIDQKMPMRIWEYIREIITKEENMQGCICNNTIYPIVVPIVIYTGYQKWNVKTNFAQKQYQSQKYKEYAINLKYNLIAVQNYTFEELLNKKTLLANIMIIEKCKNGDEINEQMNEIIEIVEDSNDREVLIEIIISVLTPIIGKEKAIKMLEKIKSKEEIGMSPLTKFFFDTEYKGWKKGIREGKKEGKKQGIKEGKMEAIKESVKNMLQLGEKEEKIIKYVGISEEELENIKSTLTN